WIPAARRLSASCAGPTQRENPCKRAVSPPVDPDAPMPISSPEFHLLQHTLRTMACQALIDAGRVQEAEEIWISAATDYICEATRTTGTTQHATEREYFTEAHPHPPPPPRPRRVDGEQPT